MPSPDAYSIFDEWYKTCDWILQAGERMPKHTRFTLSGRIVNTALDVTALLTEAIYRKDRVDTLRRINLLLEQLRIFFRLSKDRRYISLSQYEFVIDSINRVGKMTGGWLRSLHPNHYETDKQFI